MPRVLTTAAGAPSEVVAAPDGRRHVVRLLSYLPGGVLAEVPHPPQLLRNVGATLARLGRALPGFFHPAAGHELLWALKLAARLREHALHIEDAERRRLADRFLERFETRVLPRLPGLRAQVIHNDVNCQNTLVAARLAVGVNISAWRVKDRPENLALHRARRSPLLGDPRAPGRHGSRLRPLLLPRRLRPLSVPQRAEARRLARRPRRVLRLRSRAGSPRGAQAPLARGRRPRRRSGRGCTVARSPSRTTGARCARRVTSTRASTIG